MVWKHFLKEFRIPSGQFCFCLPFSLGFQLVLSVGRGLLILVTLICSAGISEDGLWPHGPSFAGLHPCCCPQLPAFTERARGSSSLLCHHIMLTLSLFWARNPLSDTSVGNSGAGAISSPLCLDKPHLQVSLHVHMCWVF